MKYLTTLEVAHELKVSKQTLLNWLYAGKVPEPPRNKKGYRLWSPSRVSLVKRLIGEGRLPHVDGLRPVQWGQCGDDLCIAYEHVRRGGDQREGGAARRDRPTRQVELAAMHLHRASI